MVDAKITHAEASGAQLLLGGDMGCLLNIAGRISREGKTLDVRHFAEVLAGKIYDPAIGKGDET